MTKLGTFLRRGALPWLATLMLAGIPAATAAFRADAEALTRDSHRLSGTPESKRAADYVLARLRDIGPDQVIDQPFPVTQTLPKRCEVVLEGRAEPLSLLPMRPNGIIPPVTPPDGIRGRVVHVGAATAEEFSRTSVRDAIVVAQYNTGDSWLRAFRLGAKAIIFVREGPADSRHAHYVECSANLPRYYYEGPAADIPEGGEATIRGEIVWQAGQGRNIYAYFRGTDPIFSQDKEELIILAANLDSFGEVPRLSPGARGAANCAALLKLAEYVKNHRPKRHVLFAFFDNQARAHEGVSRFYRALEAEKAEHTVEARQASWDAEQTFLGKLDSLASSDEPLAAESDVRSRMDVVQWIGKRRWAIGKRVGEADFLAKRPFAELRERGGIDNLTEVRERVTAALVDKAASEIEALQTLADELREQAAEASRGRTAAELAEFRGRLAQRCEETKAIFELGADVLREVVSQESARSDFSSKELHAFRTVRQALEIDYNTELEDIKKVRRELLERLGDKAKRRAYLLKDEAYKLRDEANLIRKEYSLQDQEMPPEAARRIEEINRRVNEEIEPEKDDWNELQRILGRLRRQFGAREKPEISSLVQEKLDIVLEAVREDVTLRREEMDQEEVALKADAEIKTLIGNSWICLHASLLLGDTCDKWGLIIGGESPLHSGQDNPGLYGKIQAVFNKANQAYAGPDGGGSLFVAASADQTLQQTRVLWGAPFLIHSGEIAGMFGIYNLALGTAQEGLPREGTPDDIIATLDLDAIEAQTDDIAQALFGPPAVPREGPGSLEALNALLHRLHDLPQDAAWSMPQGLDDEQTAALAAVRAEIGQHYPDLREQLDAIPMPDRTVAAVTETLIGANPILAAVANQDGLSLRRGIVAGKEYVTPGFREDTVRGAMVMGLLPGSSIPNTPMPGAVVQFRLRPNYSLAYVPTKPYAFDNFQILRTTRNGVYSIGPVSGGWLWRVAGGFAAIFNERGEITQVSDQESYRTVRWRLNVFRCNSGQAPLPPQLRTDRLPGEEVKVLSARANADLEGKKSYSETTDGMVSWYAEEREKSIKLFSLRQLVGLNNGDQDYDESVEVTDPIGEGFSMVGNPPAIDVPARSASDLWRLNESRLDILRDKGILDSSLAELHGRSEDILIEAKEEASPLRRESLATSSFWSSQPVYRKVRGMLDDLVFAVLILLALSVPFAFAVERVVVGAVTIYRQISWFAGFFAVTFTILYVSHPAFAIANTPIIIFLGFAILVMSMMVIFIIMRKFEHELKALQGMTATVHAADVSGFSTFMAAMQMGISTMRRRPLRTALTAITIILLTFTILSFASFGTQSGIVTLFSAPNPAYSGIFVHNVNWQPLSEDLRDIIKGRWPEGLRVCRRLWISPKTQDNPGLLISRDDATRPITIRGILGIDPHELEEREQLQKLFGDIDDETILVTRAVAGEDNLNVEPGDYVLVKGRRLRVGKLLDSVRVSAAKDMDTSSILPADFTEATSTQQTTEAEEDAELMTQRNWASLPVDQVVVVSANTAKALGASLYGLMVYTDDTSVAVDVAGDLARMLPFPIAATRDNGVYRHLLGTVLRASGAKDLFFPIVLGGLVIFGTMLGSVADRQKEIYTFSALGLAPKHVATLFFAESMVYSLIGGMGGYLLAQGTMKLLGVMSEYGLVRVPEMNMSSTNTIVTILLVMATVMVSAIYPAIKASKSANPGLMRMWRPPAPQGDILDLVFPFTVSEYDITGVVSFLREHFNNHTDTGLGQFMTSNVQLVKENDGSLGLDASLALAPFDLGVSQTFALRSAPSEIPGIDEVRVLLKRQSGQPKDWRRLNKVFLDDLRQQFLIWRSIPHETMELYRERTLTAFGDADENSSAHNGRGEDA